MAQSTIQDDEDWTKVQESRQKIRKRLEQLGAAVAAGSLGLPKNVKQGLTPTSNSLESESQTTEVCEAANDGMMLDQPLGNQIDDAFNMFLSSDSVSDLAESTVAEHCSHEYQLLVSCGPQRIQDSISLKLHAGNARRRFFDFTFVSPASTEHQGSDLRFDHGHPQIA
ncbi:hypothetical protein EPUS_03112 [Endocarpon pusillum Z07020]|uniref:Uncharacterized protein n=1 Tax=Endocarpon pusillum (strain Z07020 / HMAS-L-300199) TaxID=1263415 RepID=U1HRY2_ENDPU|nr:uncharacterized protein EPUS_03112 [Endocarpon pusillum Z07020]ERF73280.1 hypothetical protein EPUS_03112 [Endocarpon pusillum Z07020]